MSVSMGNERWSNSSGVGCNTAGYCKVSSLVSSLRRTSLATSCAQGVAAEPISAPWQLCAGLWSSTSIVLGSPHS